MACLLAKVQYEKNIAYIFSISYVNLYNFLINSINSKEDKHGDSNDFRKTARTNTGNSPAHIIQRPDRVIDERGHYSSRCSYFYSHTSPRRSDLWCHFAF